MWKWFLKTFELFSIPESTKSHVRWSWAKVSRHSTVKIINDFDWPNGKNFVFLDLIEKTSDMSPVHKAAKMFHFINKITLRLPIQTSKHIFKILYQFFEISKNDRSWKDSSKYFNPQAPDGFTPSAPVAQKIADQRWLIANSAKIGTFFI